MKKNWLIIVGIFICLAGFSQEKITENTLRLVSESPEASINDVTWLKGDWINKIYGGMEKEVWNLPVAGIMKGSYKLIINNEVSSQAMLSIYEESNRLILRIQQVSKDLNGREILTEAVSHPFVKLTISKIYFDGITFEQVNSNRIIIYTSKKNSNGTFDEVKQIFFREGADRCLI